MSKIVTLDSTRTFAAIRAHRTMVAKLLETAKNPVARAALQQAIELYDVELADAPATPVHQPADRKLSAYRAHRTMLLAKVKGTRGKARTAIQAKIADYDLKLAA